MSGAIGHGEMFDNRHINNAVAYFTNQIFHIGFTCHIYFKLAPHKLAMLVPGSIFVRHILRTEATNIYDFFSKFLMTAPWVLKELVPARLGQSFLISIRTPMLKIRRSHDPGGRLNKKDGLTRYGDSHVKDKTS